MAYDGRISHSADLPERGPASRHPGPVRAAFSLVELLVVLLVVSLLALLIVPNLEVVKYRMDGAVRGAVAALVAAQRQAVVRQHDVVVAFDTANRRLRIHQDANNNGVIDSGEMVRMVPLDDDVLFGLGGAPPLFGDSIVGFAETQGGLPAARFLRSGSAAEEGHFYLTSARTADTALYPEDTRAVKVDRATGRVTWYYYDPGDWKKGF